MEIESLVLFIVCFMVAVIVLIHLCMLRDAIISILWDLKPTTKIKKCESPLPSPPYRHRKKLSKKKASVEDYKVVGRHTFVTLSNPCQRCGTCNAKTNCSHHCCSTCCRIKCEPCDGHRTGYSYAVSLIETACDHRIKSLDLSYAYLRHCPPNVPAVGYQLTSLNLSNNKIQSIPENIGLLVNLKELFLQYNNLTKIPESVCNLIKLEELDIKNNCLSTLPDHIGKLRSLIILNVTNNKLSRVPRSIGQLKRLEEFTAQNNLLEHLPDEICNIRVIKVMYIAENRLKTLPFHFGNLQKLLELDVSNCDLEFLPESFSLCKSLEKLWLSNNRLSCLPSNFGSFWNLKVLHVKNNCIKYFPASLAELQLSTFTAQHNQLLDETAASLMSQQSIPKVPTLLEWAAIAIYNNNISVSKGGLPESLLSLLTSRQLCTSCNGPVYIHYKRSIKFKTISVCYRLPLCTIQCFKCQRNFHT